MGKRKPSPLPKVVTALNGKPPGNRNKFRAEHIRVAKAMAALGAVEEEIADACGVDRRTFQRWGQRYPALREAMKIPRETADDRMELSVFKLGQDRWIEEEEIKIIDGQIIKVTVRKFIKGDATAALAWLNNRRRDQWRRNPEVYEPLSAPETDETDITAENKREFARRFALVMRQGLLN
jgi:hypothetical protein